MMIESTYRRNPRDIWSDHQRLRRDADLATLEQQGLTPADVLMEDMGLQRQFRPGTNEVEYVYVTIFHTKDPNFRPVPPPAGAPEGWSAP